VRIRSSALWLPGATRRPRSRRPAGGDDGRQTVEGALKRLLGWLAFAHEHREVLAVVSATSICEVEVRAGSRPALSGRRRPNRHGYAPDAPRRPAERADRRRWRRPVWLQTPAWPARFP